MTSHFLIFELCLYYYFLSVLLTRINAGKKEDNNSYRNDHFAFGLKTLPFFIFFKNAFLSILFRSVKNYVGEYFIVQWFATLCCFNHC